MIFVSVLTSYTIDFPESSSRLGLRNKVSVTKQIPIYKSLSSSLMLQ